MYVASLSKKLHLASSYADKGSTIKTCVHCAVHSLCQASRSSDRRQMKSQGVGRKKSYYLDNEGIFTPLRNRIISFR